MHIIDTIKDYISRRKMAHRTMLAYINDIESFLHKYPALATHPESLRPAHINDYLNELKSSVVSTALYNQTLSALKILCQYMHDTYHIPLLDFTQHTWNSSFPLTCTDEQIIETLKGLETSYEDTRLYLIIRLLSAYKMQLKDIPHITWTETGISLQGKNITLKVKDKEVVASYRKHARLLHGLTEYVFVVPSGLDYQPISQPALWSMLKKTFAQAPAYRMKRSSLQTNPFSLTHPRG